MKPVRFERLEESLGEQHFDLDRARGTSEPDGARMFRFPEPGYTPRRVGWDCYNDMLQTRGCEAERIDDHDDRWAMTRICPVHERGDSVAVIFRMLSEDDRETIRAALRAAKAADDETWRARFEDFEKRLDP